MDFREALKEYGFDRSHERSSRGAQTFSAQPNRYLTYWVHAFTDGTALFTWEFTVTDYLLERGIQLGSSEALNLFMYPTEDSKGPQEGGWLRHAMDQAEARLAGVDFVDPEGRGR